MAKAVAVNARADASAKPLLRPVTLLRIALIVGILALWQAIAESGLLYRDVVPSLLAIGGAFIETLANPAFYFHLYTTSYEIALAMLFGGVSGLIVGLLLGGSPLLSKAYEVYLYYLGPCPKIIFFPLMILWFGIGPGIEDRHGRHFVLLSDRAQCRRRHARNRHRADPRG